MLNTSISVIIVNWNGRKWLDKCLKSIQSQSYTSFEIIVVDNNSSDDSIKFIEHTFPTVKIIKNTENSGFGKGNNIGVQHANGTNLLLLNSDTWMPEYFLENILIKFNELKYDIVAPREADYNGKKREKYITLIDPLGHPIFIYNPKRIRNFYLSGVCVLLSKKLYIKCGGFDENFFMYVEDVDFFWRLKLLGKNFGYVNDLYINHAGAGSTGEGIKEKLFLWRNQNTLQMLIKNYAWFSLVWVLPLYLFQNILEMFFFLIILKPAIAYTYFNSWVFNFKMLNVNLQKRVSIQAKRIIPERVILRDMYPSFAKLRHLIFFFQSKQRNLR